MSESHHPTDGVVQFEFDGKTVSATSGQSVAGALLAADEQVLSRSAKFHRPRGLFCGAGVCTHCQCTVDGVPNTKTCTTPVKAGMVVKSQSVGPTARFDLLGWFERWQQSFLTGNLLKSLYKPSWLWPVCERLLRSSRAAGTLPARNAERQYADHVAQYCDIAVVGGGWAGLHAAEEAALAGFSVVLIDDQPDLGGHLRFDPALANRRFDAVTRHVRENPAIDVLTRAQASAWNDDQSLSIQRGQRLIHLYPRQVVFATGVLERSLVFENNDLPGVLLASAAQRLLHLDQVRLEGPAVVVTDNEQGYRVARQLTAAGVELAAVVDLRENPPPSEFPVQTELTIAQAEGTTRVTGVRLGRFSGQPQPVIPCRWIIQAVGFAPLHGLAMQAGSRFDYNSARDMPTATFIPVKVHLAGAMNGWHDPEAAARDGRRAALAAACDLRPDDVQLAKQRDELAVELTSQPLREDPSRHYISPTSGTRKFVCSSADVTEHELCEAIAEGFTDPIALAQYAGLNSAGCNGIPGSAATLAIRARESQLDIGQVVGTRAVSLERPIPLGLLAGRNLRLACIRRSPIYHWHLEHSARFIDQGDWKIPQRYGNLDAELQALSQSAGLLDISDQDDQSTVPESEIPNLCPTAGWGRFLLAGPASLEIAKEIFGIDLSTVHQSDGQIYHGSVDGVSVDCLVRTANSTTEVEIRLPAQWARSVWETILAEGAAFGVAAVGHEAKQLLDADETASDRITLLKQPTGRHTTAGHPPRKSSHQAIPKPRKPAIARGPIVESQAKIATRIELRSGSLIATRYADEPPALGDSVIDVSQRSKSLLQGEALLTFLATLGDIQLDVGQIYAHDQWYICRTSPLAAVSFGPLPLDAKSATEVTGFWGTIAMLGPHADQILAKTTSIDLRERSFPAGSFQTATLAGVAVLICRFARRFEIHIPRHSAESVWNILLDAGAEFHLRPAGADFAAFHFV